MAKAQKDIFGSEEKIRQQLKRLGGSYGLHKDQHFVNLLSKMLKLSQNQRIDPKEILDHPFCYGNE